MRYEQQRLRGASGTWRRFCAIGLRILCSAVTVAVISVFCWQLGSGIARVRDGEMTSAQMLEQMGEWLRGQAEN